METKRKRGQLSSSLDPLGDLAGTASTPSSDVAAPAEGPSAEPAVQTVVPISDIQRRRSRKKQPQAKVDTAPMVNTVVRLPEALAEELRELSSLSSQPVAALVRESVKEYLPRLRRSLATKAKAAAEQLATLEKKS